MRHLRSITVVALVLLIGLVGSMEVRAATEHCPAGGTKTEGENNALVLPPGTVGCVKGSTDAVSFVADGITTLVAYLANGHDVSYYVVYTEVTPSTAPSTEPSVEPSVAPSAAPSSGPPKPCSFRPRRCKPFATPTPTASPSVTPERTPSLTPPPTNAAVQVTTTGDPAFLVLAGIVAAITAITLLQRPSRRKDH